MVLEGGVTYQGKGSNWGKVPCELVQEEKNVDDASSDRRYPNALSS